jgi:hypothetical protein
MTWWQWTAAVLAAATAWTGTAFAAGVWLGRHLFRGGAHRM